MARDRKRAKQRQQRRARAGSRAASTPRDRASEQPDDDALAAPDPLEHASADAVHEHVVRTDVVGNLVATEPHLEADIVFGMRAFELVEDRLATHLMSSWKAGRPSVRRPFGS